MNIRPEISVCMITYNHEKYIRQAVSSVLAQESSVPFEIVIGDDASTDQTAEICGALQEENPGKIRLLLQESNKGMIFNFADTLSACKGKYIAFCEGDDYWTESRKLVMQYNYMEEHPQTGLCYTNYKVQDFKGNVHDNELGNKEVFEGNCRDIFVKGSPGVMTVTVMIRRDALNEAYFKLIQDRYFLTADFVMHMWIAYNYQIGYLPAETGVFRLHPASITNTVDIVKKWRFMRSHVYMRKKFLSYTGYLPHNYTEINASECRQVLRAAVKAQLFKNYGVAAYKQLYRTHMVTITDKLQYLMLVSKPVYHTAMVVRRTRNKLKRVLAGF